MTPLAWRNLVHDRRRLVIAVSGVTFAVLLIFMQLGFLHALLESTVQLLRRVNGQLIIISSARYTLPANERFDLRRLQQAKGVPGVKAAYPVYIETVAGALRQRGARAFPIRVLAFRAEDPVLDSQPLLVHAPEIRRPDAAIADTASRGKYGFPATEEDLWKYQAELSGREVHLVGQFRLGVDFATDGNLLMTAANFANFFPARAAGYDPLSVVDLGVIQLADPADAPQVLRLLQEELPEDVQVFTREQLIAREKQFWRNSAPVGYIFLVGVYVGFVVGVVICYQIIYTDITAQMKEFATLKAMGYTGRYFLMLVLQQAAYLSMLGFVPGMVLSYVCYRLLSVYTGLTMQLSLTTAGTVLLVTMLMCGVSGVLALRKLLAMDPAELF